MTQMVDGRSMQIRPRSTARPHSTGEVSTVSNWLCHDFLFKLVFVQFNIRYQILWTLIGPYESARQILISGLNGEVREKKVWKR